MREKLFLLVGSFAVAFAMVACQPEPQGDPSMTVETGNGTPDAGDTQIDITIDNEPSIDDLDVPPPADPGDGSTLDDY